MAASPINGIPASGPTPLHAVPANPPARAVSDSSASDEEAVTVDTFPASPPPEVLDAIAAAGEAFDKLAAQGLSVALGTDETGALSASLQDRQGRTLSQLKPSEVLALAEGTSLTPTRRSDDVDEQHERD